MGGYYSMAQAAKAVGVHKLTLYRWERQKKIPLPSRLRRNNQRVYTDDDIAKLKAYKDATVEIVEPSAA